VGALPLETVLSSIVESCSHRFTVLITGETGTGKELIARAILRVRNVLQRVYYRQLRRSSLFAHRLGIVCHEKGAFTGASQQRRGRFELAHSGTIFLDEIGSFPGNSELHCSSAPGAPI